MIVYYSGPEGGCKTVFIAYEAHKHYELGGEVWAFPGFELYDDNGKTVSRTVQFWELPSLLDEMLYVVIVMDEIQNYMNHHNWYSKMIDWLAYGAAAQRRKRQFVILASGPIFGTLPRDLSFMFHEVVHCQDRHWRYKNIPRGQQCEFYREDRRGVLSGYIGSRTRPQIFWPGKYFKYYDTYSLTDPRAQFAKIKMQGREITIGPNGNIIENNKGPQYSSDPATMEKYVNDYLVQQNSQSDKMIQQVRQALDSLKAKGLNRVKSSLIYEILGVKTHGEKWHLGQLLKSYFGVVLHKYSGTYIIPETLPSNQPFL